MGSPALGASPQPDLNSGQGIGIGMGRAFECANFDVEEVQKIANVLMVTLAEACVQKTVGDLFKAPGAVVGEVKKEMLDYLQQQSEIYANSPPAPPGTLMDPPSKIVSDLLEQFVKAKQNLFGKMSSRIKLGNKDDKVDAFLQELDRGGVWMPGRREVLARALVKRIDKPKVKHCGRRFDREEELHNHRLQCPIRPVQCVNEGCMEVFSAVFGEKHDAVCFFKPLPCRQKCGGLVRRGEMEVHVNTVCPMKLVSCPFEKLGCVEPVYQGKLVQHCEEYVPKHVMFMLAAMQKQEGVAFSHGERIALLEKRKEEERGGERRREEERTGERRRVEERGNRSGSESRKVACHGMTRRRKRGGERKRGRERKREKESKTEEDRGGGEEKEIKRPKRGEVRKEKERGGGEEEKERRRKRRKPGGGREEESGVGEEKEIRRPTRRGKTD
ncbi:hypothetical protein CBR_g23522 [Chara braunii]|uniref:TRAF-type domain-containing protein n=1 Tax=Chara braunii TaxID=69332 RepID=A0A388L4F6_CHABU|nr:hypothetical protein CBR_g23522 [Chara braunii]|eukprot:GBG77195.1 hypothetical protein CBR_g23522 [Chara braunii]